MYRCVRKCVCVCVCVCPHLGAAGPAEKGDRLLVVARHLDVFTRGVHGVGEVSRDHGVDGSDALLGPCETTMGQPPGQRSRILLLKTHLLHQGVTPMPTKARMRKHTQR